MKQQVEVTLKLNLWLEATMNEDDIVTHVRSSLPNAFGEELTEMQNPVDIIEVRQEAEIYGVEETQQDGMSGYSVYELADEHATYGADAGKFLVTSADHEREFSGPMSKKDAKAYAGMLTALKLASDRLGTLIDADEDTENDCKAYDAVCAAIVEAEGRAA